MSSGASQLEINAKGAIIIALESGIPIMNGETTFNNVLHHPTEATLFYSGYQRHTPFQIMRDNIRSTTTQWFDSNLSWKVNKYDGDLLRQINIRIDLPGIGNRLVHRNSGNDEFHQKDIQRMFAYSLKYNPTLRQWISNSARCGAPLVWSEKLDQGEYLDGVNGKKYKTLRDLDQNTDWDDKGGEGGKYSNMASYVWHEILSLKVATGDSKACCEVLEDVDVYIQTLRLGGFAVLTGKHERTDPHNNTALPCDTLRQPSWCDGVGHAFVQELQMNIGSVKIDQLTGKFMHVLDRLHNEKDHRAGRLAGYYDSEKERRAASMQQTRLYVKPPFWFTKSNGGAIPLCAMEHHSVEFTLKCPNPETLVNHGSFDGNNTTNNPNWSEAATLFTWYEMEDGVATREFVGNTFIRDGEDHWSKAGRSKNLTVFAPGSLENTAHQATKPRSLRHEKIEITMDATTIILAREERTTYKENELQYLMSHHCIVSQSTHDYNRHTLDDEANLYMRLPTSQVIWVYHPDDAKNTNDHFRFVSKEVITGRPLHLIKTQQLKLNQNPQFHDINVKSGAQDLRMQMEFASGAREDNTGIYCYNWCLDPSSITSTGTLNASRIQDITFRMVTADHCFGDHAMDADENPVVALDYDESLFDKGTVTKTSSMTRHFFQVYWNIFTVTPGGQAGVVYNAA